MCDLRTGVGLAAILMAGCAARAPQTYRLLPKMLVPPGVTAADQSKRTITVEAAPGGGKCAPSDAMDVRRSGTRVRVTVSAADLTGKAAGWLREWTAAREADGCLAAGEGLKLGQRILEALPLDPAVAYRLWTVDLRASYVDLGPEDRLQVDGPILREGTPADAPVLESSNVSGGAAGTLNVELRTSSNLLGFERSWYAIQPKERGAGFAIVPLYAESHIQGVVERQAQPRVQYLKLRPDAAFYRMFYRGDRTIILVSAATRVELDSETERLKQDGGACGTFPKETCVLLPQNVGMNALITVTVNGKEVSVPVRSNLRSALRTAGTPNAEPLVARMAVRKLYAGKPAAVEFDRATVDILNLMLVGGEEIEWK